MENDNGLDSLELSLGLSCGVSSANNSKEKNGSSLDIKMENSERTNKIVANFKNFLNAVDQRQELDAGAQISARDKPPEIFFTQLSRCSDDDAPISSNAKGLWFLESRRSAESEEERRQESGSKRSMPFEINHQKKLELDFESIHSDLHEKPRTSLISITADDSTTENEDVTESEVETSPSITIGLIDSKVLDLQTQKRFKSSSDSDLKMNNFASFSVCLENSCKEDSSVDAFGTSTHPPSMIQAVHSLSREQLGLKPALPGCLPMMFGFSPVQLPVMDKKNSFGLISHFRQMQPSSGYDGRTLDQANGDDKQLVGEEGSSPQNGDDVKGGKIIFGAKDTSKRSTAEFISFNFPDIKPGIAVDLKFGGNGSYPDLPWVSTSSPGPNGRPISGVSYQYSTSQIKIVCACHGSHMSPEDFIRHASEEQDGDAGCRNNNVLTA